MNLIACVNYADGCVRLELRVYSVPSSDLDSDGEEFVIEQWHQDTSPAETDELIKSENFAPRRFPNLHRAMVYVADEMMR